MKTDIRKDIRDGWRAETIVPVKDNQELRITTSKGYSGLITSFATIGYREGSSWSTTLFEDYSEAVIREKARATQAVIVAQHDRALALVPDILKRVEAHYRKRAA